jgi:hypothetical protein
MSALVTKSEGNLAWVYLTTERPIETATIISELTSLDAVGLSLLKAGLEIARDNFGLAVGHLGDALDIGLDPETSAFFEDLLRLLRLGEARLWRAVDRLVRRKRKCRTLCAGLRRISRLCSRRARPARPEPGGSRGRPQIVQFPSHATWAPPNRSEAQSTAQGPAAKVMSLGNE